MLNPLDLTVQDYAKLLQRVTLSAKVCHLCKSASLIYWYLEIWQQGCCSPDMDKWFILVSLLAESNWAERKFQLNFLLFCCNYFSQETLLCNLDLSAIFIFLQKYLLVYLYFVALFFPFLPKNSVIFFRKYLVTKLIIPVRLELYPGLLFTVSRGTKPIKLDFTEVWEE